MTEKQHIPTGERAEFETWVRRDWPGAPLRFIRDALPVDDPRYGQYCDDALQRAWVGWQARAALAQPSPAPERLHVDQPWLPENCPITGRKFFMWLEHPEHGMVPTYGGPFDSFTLAEPDGEGTFQCERYDHDAGFWTDAWEWIDLRLIDGQRDDCEHGELENLRAQRDAAQVRTTELLSELDQAADGADILRDLIASIEKHGNYSAESTINFLQQALCRFSRFASAPVAEAGQVPQAWLDVQAERRRQVEAEGWTPGHDDAHGRGAMALAAGCYARHAHQPPNWQGRVPDSWPWGSGWWKPSSPRRNLVKAGALILAEIERLDRCPTASAT